MLPTYQVWKTCPHFSALSRANQTPLRWVHWHTFQDVWIHFWGWSLLITDDFQRSLVGTLSTWPVQIRGEVNSTMKMNVKYQYHKLKLRPRQKQNCTSHGDESNKMITCKKMDTTWDEHAILFVNLVSWVFWLHLQLFMFFWWYAAMHNGSILN